MVFQPIRHRVKPNTTRSYGHKNTFLLKSGQYLLSVSMLGKTFQNAQNFLIL